MTSCIGYRSIVGLLFISLSLLPARGIALTARESSRPLEPSATFLVTNLNDSGTGSLRQAIADSNSSVGVADMIAFQPGIAGTIELTSGELIIKDSVTIQGPGPDVITISGRNSRRVFQFDEGQTVALRGVKLTDGNGFGSTNNGFGGALINYGTANLTNVVISNSTASSAGGAIVTLGPMTISSSTIAGNNSVNGGGIFSQGTLAIMGSTISGNTAAEGGGAMHLQHSSASLLNSTVSGNVTHGTTSSAATILFFANNGTRTLSIANSTIANNTLSTPGGVGGVLSAGQGTGVSAAVTLRSSIVANNSAPNLATLSTINGIGSIASAGHNLASDSGSGYLTGSGDKVNSDPLIGPLAANGGRTQTHALTQASPAIDAGNGSGMFTDQRGPGFDRVVDLAPPNAAGGDGADIGAFELQSQAATGSISGRIVRPSGLALSNTRVNLVDDQGVSRSATSSSFGLFSFTGLPTGRSYILTVVSKRYRFTPQNITLSGDITGLELVGLE